MSDSESPGEVNQVPRVTASVPNDKRWSDITSHVHTFLYSRRHSNGDCVPGVLLFPNTKPFPLRGCLSPNRCYEYIGTHRSNAQRSSQKHPIVEISYQPACEQRNGEGGKNKVRLRRI
ncbi:hypothetical protein Hanom_Chr12g01118181 [Helianthus anomalus]